MLERLSRSVFIYSLLYLYWILDASIQHCQKPQQRSWFADDVKLVFAFWDPVRSDECEVVGSHPVIGRDSYFYAIDSASHAQYEWQWLCFSRISEEYMKKTADKVQWQQWP